MKLVPAFTTHKVIRHKTAKFREQSYTHKPLVLSPSELKGFWMLAGESHCWKTTDYSSIPLSPSRFKVRKGMLPALYMLFQVKGFCHQLLLIGRLAKRAWLINAGSKGNCVLASCTIRSIIKKQRRERTQQQKSGDYLWVLKRIITKVVTSERQFSLLSEHEISLVTYWRVFRLVPSSTRWILSTKLGMSTTFKEEAILVLLASCSALIERLMSSLELSSSSFFPCGIESSCFSGAVFQNKLAPRRELEIYPFKGSHYYLLRHFGL